MITISPLIFFPLLYAETHYRFKYFISFLRKAEPEILADIPHRLEPGVSLPVLLLVKDSHQYPIENVHVRIELRQGNKTYGVVKRDIAGSISEPLWWRVVSVQFENDAKDLSQFVEVDVYIEYVVNGKQRTCKNDNYRTSSKRSLRVFRSDVRLPVLPGWALGDTHTHSSHTDDQVEFGSPIEASVELSRAMGLSYFCVTDHSYDLDDRIDNYLLNDPDLPKWKLQQAEIDSINSRAQDFAVIRGEEVSCFNHGRRNIHLLLWGTRKYYAGSGDSAEHWFHTNAEHSIRDILNTLDKDTVAYAGHPTEPAPFFQWLLIKRGVWDLIDMSEEGLSGIQILNGEENRAFLNGLESWKVLLLRGRRIFIAAGDDAHGNFNRFRQIGIPFFTIRENGNQLFGKIRTALRHDILSEQSLLQSLRSGRSAITNGPLIVFEITNEYGATAFLGGEISGRRLQLHITGVSSVEFGSFEEVRVIHGKIGTERELVRARKRFSANVTVDFSLPMEFPSQNSASYLRIEGFTCRTKSNERGGFCYTNPIWIDHR